MTSTQGYKIVETDARNSERVTRFYESKNGFVTARKNQQKFNLSRLVDGQSLAGTGALVFEGELLDLSKR